MSPHRTRQVNVVLKLYEYELHGALSFLVKRSAATGTRTPASRVTGGDTNPYTITAVT
jgi:hypothetical protein